jgi:hypothetical protein
MEAEIFMAEIQSRPPPEKVDLIKKNFIRIEHIRQFREGNRRKQPRSKRRSGRSDHLPAVPIPSDNEQSLDNFTVAEPPTVLYLESQL